MFDFFLAVSVSSPSSAQLLLSLALAAVKRIVVHSTIPTKTCFHHFFFASSPFLLLSHLYFLFLVLSFGSLRSSWYWQSTTFNALSIIVYLLNFKGYFARIWFHKLSGNISSFTFNLHITVFEIIYSKFYLCAHIFTFWI